MYEKGYRVGALSASIVLDVVNSDNNQLEIKKSGNNDIDVRGHLEIVRGHEYSATLARNATVLTQDETLGTR